MPIRVERITVRANATGAAPLLDGISCTIQERSLTLLIGPAGSGKSTLLRVLAGLQRADEGRVAYDGVPLWENGQLNRNLLKQHAMAFQFPERQLFASTLHKEFHYSLRPYRIEGAEREKRIHDALEEMALPRSCLPSSPFILSGGMKRRAALATLLPARTPWLFLDEPSAGIDAQAAAALRERLAEWKQARGIVMATHDWEWFLPVADRIIILAGGKLEAVMTPQELAEHPEAAVRAGLGMPRAMQLARALRRNGMELPDRLWTPEQLAERIAAACRQQTAEAAVEKGAAADVPPVSPRRQRVQASPSSEARGRIYRLQAGTKWLMFVLLSVLILLLPRNWPGALAGLLLGAGSLGLLAPRHVQRAVRLSRMPALFLLITAAIAGIRLGAADGLAVGFSIHAAASALCNMLPFLSVTVASFTFTLSTSLTEMKRALEKALSVLERAGLPAGMLALTASLTLRFIPMILTETERFAEIAAARGKNVTRKGTVRLRDVPAFVIPLLVSLFQMVEDLITAMEIKGRRR